MSPDEFPDPTDPTDPSSDDAVGIIGDLGLVIQTIFDEFDAPRGLERQVETWILVAETVDDDGIRQVTTVPSDRRRASAIIGLLRMADDMTMAGTRFLNMGDES